MFIFRRSGHPWIELQSQSHFCKLFTTCTYPGSLTYKFALRLYDKQIEVHNYLVHVQEKSAWMSDYNVRHNFSSPLRVHELTANTPSLIDDLATMAKEAHTVMADVFDEVNMKSYNFFYFSNLIIKLRLFFSFITAYNSRIYRTEYLPADCFTAKTY